MFGIGDAFRCHATPHGCVRHIVMSLLTLLSTMLVACAVSGCASKPDAKRPDSDPAKADASEDTLDGSIPWDGVGQLLGWFDDVAVIREELVFTDDTTAAYFYSLDADGTRKPLDQNEWRDQPSGGYFSGPPGLQPGIPVVVDYSNQVDTLRLELKIEADSIELEQIYAALGSGDTLFPVVEADLRLRIGTGRNRPREVWHEKRVLSVYPGETWYEFDLPAIQTAVMSPGGHALYFKLLIGGGEENHVVRIMSMGQQ